MWGLFINNGKCIRKGSNNFKPHKLIQNLQVHEFGLEHVPQKSTVHITNTQTLAFSVNNIHWDLLLHQGENLETIQYKVAAQSVLSEQEV